MYKPLKLPVKGCRLRSASGLQRRLLMPDDMEVDGVQGGGGATEQVREAFCKAVGGTWLLTCAACLSVLFSGHAM